MYRGADLTPEDIHQLILEARRARAQAMAEYLRFTGNVLIWLARQAVSAIRGAVRQPEDQYLAQARDLRDLSRRIRLLEQQHLPMLDPGR